MDRKLNVVMIGAGAVGLGVGCGLATQGVGLHIIANREGQRRALLEEGISRSGLFGDLHAPPGSFDVSTSIDSLATERADVWLVCVKATESERLAQTLGAVWQKLDHSPAVVLCQNGWGNAETFSRFLPSDRVFNARVITGFERMGETHVRITAHADPIHIGSLYGAKTEELRGLSDAIQAGGVPCALSESIEKDLWAKVLYNGLLNPLGALVGVPYGALGEREETRAIMESIAEETFRVMHVAGYSSHWDSPSEYLDTFYEQLLPPTAEHQSSMLQDLHAGRPTEIDQLCGAICTLAEKHGIEAPLNRALHTLIRVAEQRH